MNKEFAAKWVAALREEGRGQVPGVLEVKDSKGKVGQCCLGVACEILHKEGKLVVEWFDDSSGGQTALYKSHGDLGNSYTLGGDIVALMGAGSGFGGTGLFGHIEGAHEYLKSDERFAPAFEPKHSSIPCELSSLNDRGVPFAAIADFIEKFADQL